jgi:hypothetical protein
MDDLALSKVQMALLCATMDASVAMATPGLVPTGLFDRIARHFFRQDRVFGAVRELVRSRHLATDRAGQNFRVAVLNRARFGTLPGCEPEPLCDAELLAMIREAGIAIRPVSESVVLADDGDVASDVNLVQPSCECVPSEPKRTVRIPATERFRRRFRLLANHRLAERWYGGELPSELSRAAIIIDRFDIGAAMALRSKLVREGLMESAVEPSNRQLSLWHVTPLGTVHCEQSNVAASITPEEFAEYAVQRGFVPLERSDQSGR